MRWQQWWRRLPWAWYFCTSRVRYSIGWNRLLRTGRSRGLRFWCFGYASFSSRFRPWLGGRRLGRWLVLFSEYGRGRYCHIYAVTWELTDGGLGRWLLYASGTVLGSTVSFVVSRTVLSRFVNRLMERDKRFAALALTLKYDGLKLLCMIRLCPLPYSICNGAVSTFPTVHPLMYGLATLIISPKLLVPAFIGSRLRLLTGDEGMSAVSKAINICSIVFTVGVGVFTGWYIYKRYRRS